MVRKAADFSGNSSADATDIARRLRSNLEKLSTEAAEVEKAHSFMDTVEHTVQRSARVFVSSIFCTS